MQTSLKRQLSLKGVCIKSLVVLLIPAWTFVLGVIYEGTKIATHTFLSITLQESGAKSKPPQFIFHAQLFCISYPHYQ